MTHSRETSLPRKGTVEALNEFGTEVLVLRKKLHLNVPTTRAASAAAPSAPWQHSETRRATIHASIGILQYL